MDTQRHYKSGMNKDSKTHRKRMRLIHKIHSGDRRLREVSSDASKAPQFEKESARFFKCPAIQVN